MSGAGALDAGELQTFYSRGEWQTKGKPQKRARPTVPFDRYASIDEDGIFGMDMRKNFPLEFPYFWGEPSSHYFRSRSSKVKGFQSHTFTGLHCR